MGVSLLLVNILPQVSFDKMHLNCCLRGLTPIFKSSAKVSCSCQRNVAESFCKCCGKNYLFVNICFLQVAEQDVTETNVQLNSSRLIKQLDKVFKNSSCYRRDRETSFFLLILNSGRQRIMNSIFLISHQLI